MVAIQIGGRVIQIASKTNAAMGENLGLTDQTPEGIFVLSYRETLCPLERTHVILHELFHAAGFIQGIKLNEQQVVALEQFMGSLMVQNPEFVQRLLDDTQISPAFGCPSKEAIPAALNGRGNGNVGIH